MGSGFAPLQHNQVAFVDADSFGGGEDGDGRDLHGRTIRRRSARDAETTDLWGRMVPTAEDILVARAEGRALDAFSLSESEDGWVTIDGHPPITVNGVPLEHALADGQFDYLSPEDAEIDREYLEYLWYTHDHDAWDDALASPVRLETRAANGTAALEWIKREALAAPALNRFERDGITKLGSRLAAQLAFGEQAFVRNESEDRTWKRHRFTQYRPRDAGAFELFRLITAN